MLMLVLYLDSVVEFTQIHVHESDTSHHVLNIMFSEGS